MGDKDYCGWGCYGQAKKHGRAVRLVVIDGEERQYCTLCESRARNGLIHYRPSNGSEGRAFEARCEDCRHYIDTPEAPKEPKLQSPFAMCRWGVLDRLTIQRWSETDHAANWFDPADMMEDGECRRFTHKDDPDGATGDPPPRDCEGQMFLGEMLTVLERVPSLPAGAGAEARA